MKEIWKSVVGYEGYYEVSNLGNVKSVDRDVMRSDGVVQHRCGRIKSQFVNRDGYKTVHLSKDGVESRIGVHILVANAFVSGKFEGAEVNHKDCNRSNNNSVNLEWVTHSDNVRYAILAGNHVCTTDISGENNPNFGNHKLREVYANNKDLARLKQSRPGAKNGRATGIRMYNDSYEKTFDTIKDCASYLVHNGVTIHSNLSYVSIMVSRAARGSAECFGFRFAYT